MTCPVLLSESGPAGAAGYVAVIDAGEPLGVIHFALQSAGVEMPGWTMLHQTDALVAWWKKETKVAALTPPPTPDSTGSTPGTGR